jgi:hypothetical protein
MRIIAAAPPARGDLPWNDLLRFRQRANHASDGGPLMRHCLLLVLVLPALAGCREAYDPGLSAYPAEEPVKLDGAQEKAWADATNRMIQRQHEGKTYARHATIKALYDKTHLYLWVTTYYRPGIGRMRSWGQGMQPVDTYPLVIRSEDRIMASVSVGADGHAYAWPLAKMPTAAEARGFPRQALGMDVAVQKRKPEPGQEDYKWMSEVRLPLEVIQPLGRHVVVEISGQAWPVNFYPPGVQGPVHLGWPDASVEP